MPGPDGRAAPASIKPGAKLVFTAEKFKPEEQVSVTFKVPDCTDISVGQNKADANGKIDTSGDTTPPIPVEIGQDPTKWGPWAVIFKGLSHTSIIYFCVAAPITSTVQLPPDTDGRAEPSNFKTGDPIVFNAWGFTPGEQYSLNLQAPDGGATPVAPSSNFLVNKCGLIHDVEIGRTFAQAGNYIATYIGVQSKHKAVIHFSVSK